MTQSEQILADFAAVANEPLSYAKNWQTEHQAPVVGILPMNFPPELVHAAGALPTLLQADDEPISIGLSRIDSFYCGYNRSLVNQTMSDQFSFLSAIMLGDHCVQLLGTADTMRNHMPHVAILYDQLVSTINSPWAFSESLRCLNALKSQLEATLNTIISDAQLHASIVLFNHNRALMRQLYTMRTNGDIHLSSSAMQHIVKASMVMDRREHSTALAALLVALEAEQTHVQLGLPVFLSGHMCHAPKPEILAAIERCGARIVSDDLYTGYRYISTDVATDISPMEALTNWYLQRNENVPCPTRSARNLDWDDYILNAAQAAGAQGVILLQVKFCEPQLYYYPDIKQKLDANGMPHLLIETEHEEMPIEALITRLETFIEIAQMQARKRA